MRKLLFVLLVFVGIILLILMIFNTVITTSLQNNIAPATLPTVDSARCQQHLAAALQTSTIHTTDGIDTVGFRQFHQLLPYAYPYVHQHSRIERQFFNRWSLVYKWEGRNPDLKPIVLVASHDVADPDLATIPEWSYNPFTGKIADGFAWGCGTMRAKTAFVAILEAWDMLAKSKFEPTRTIYLVSGHDQTQGGRYGTKAIAAAFQRAKIEFEYALIAGSHISSEGVLGIEQPFAYVGIAEKNTLTLQLSASQEADLYTPLASIRQWQAPIQLDSRANRALLEYLTPELPFLQRFWFANTWLVSPCVRRYLLQDSFINASLRVDTRPSPIAYDSTQKAYISTLQLTTPANYSPEWIAQQLIRQYIDTNVVKVNTIQLGLPSRTTAPAGYVFELIHSTIKEIRPNTLVAPAAIDQASDGIYFQVLSPHVFYFAPFAWSKSDWTRYQRGVDERIALDDYYKMILFYYQFIKNTNS